MSQFIRSRTPASPASGHAAPQGRDAAASRLSSAAEPSSAHASSRPATRARGASASLSAAAPSRTDIRRPPSSEPGYITVSPLTGPAFDLPLRPSPELPLDSASSPHSFVHVDAPAGSTRRSALSVGDLDSETGMWLNFADFSFSILDMEESTESLERAAALYDEEIASLKDEIEAVMRQMTF